MLLIFQIRLLVLLFPKVSDRLLSSTIMIQILSASLSSSTAHHLAHLSKSIHHIVRHLALCLSLLRLPLDHHNSLQSRQ